MKDQLARQAPAFRILLSHDQILRRIAELARSIMTDAGDRPPLLVSVIEGARTFARHLTRQMPKGLVVHEIRASSYGSGTESIGRVAISDRLQVDVRGRDVLLLEDIVDTGRTIAALRTHFLGHGAADCRVASLLSKPSRRVVEVPIHYLGFEIPDEFVIGFGMDYAGRYRELPDVVLYEPSIEQAANS